MDQFKIIKIVEAYEPSLEFDEYDYAYPVWDHPGNDIY